MSLLALGTPVSLSPQSRFTKLPSEIQLDILEIFYLQEPLCSFYRLQRVNRKFRSMVQTTLEKYRYPTSYKIERGHVETRHRQKFVAFDRALEKVYSDDNGLTVRYRRKLSPSVLIDLHNDAARVHRAFYMAEINLGEDWSTLNYCNVDDIRCKLDYIYRLDNVERTTSFFQDYAGCRIIDTPIWKEPATKSKLEKMIIDVSKMYGENRGSRLVVIEKEEEDEYVTVTRFADQIQRWAYGLNDKNQKNEEGIPQCVREAENKACRGLRWVEGITYEMVTQDGLHLDE